LARPADQFRRSDVVLWGTVAAVASALALIAANLAALEPQGALAMLHDSRAVAAQARELTAGLAALDGSKSTLSELTDARQQLRTSAQQLVAWRQQLLAAQDQLRNAQQQTNAVAAALGSRLTALERTVAANGTQLTTLAKTAPRPVKALEFASADPDTITGAIDRPAPGFTAARSPTRPAVPQTMPAALPAPIVPEPAAGPNWTEVAALPAFAAPASPAEDASLPAADAPPYPMTPRPAAVGRPSAAPLALEPTANAGGITVASTSATASAGPGAIGPPPARRSKADVRAIGVAIGNPVTPASALASWQQIAGQVGVLLVGTSPLLATDPAGSTGKVLVAGPIPSIAAAATLCGKIEAAALSCTPMPYVGAALGGQ
jgi:multidrug efflux pump subunit AcrA (membrane-fusion protein)